MRKEYKSTDPAQDELQAHIDLYRALEWKKANPDAWGYMVNLATAEAKAGRKFGAQWLVEETRKKAFTDREGQPFKINNSHAAVFARMLAEEHSEVIPFLNRRKSRFDELIGGK